MNELKHFTPSPLGKLHRLLALGRDEFLQSLEASRQVAFGSFFGYAALPADDALPIALDNELRDFDDGADVQSFANTVSAGVTFINRLCHGTTLMPTSPRS